MGFRNWLFDSQEKTLERADALKAEAATDPEGVDVSALVEILCGDGNPQATRLAAQGLVSVAEATPERLEPHVADLVRGTRVDGPASTHREVAAAALRAYAEGHGAELNVYGPHVEESLEEELDAAKATSGPDLRFREEKVEALCHVLAVTKERAAQPELRELAGHSHPAVSDAAREALDRI